MSEERDLLKELFATPEEAVDSFFDTLKEQKILHDPNDEDVSRIIKGEAEQIASPELVETKSGYIRIQHGWHQDDYVWHISPWHEKKPWKVSLERVVFGIARVMNDTIPQSVEVKIWYPRREWEIHELTFKAIDLALQWNMTDDAIEKMNLKLFEMLNTLV